MMETLKDRPRVKMGGMLNLKASQGVPLQGGCLIWKEKWTK